MLFTVQYPMLVSLCYLWGECVNIGDGLASSPLSAASSHNMSSHHHHHFSASKDNKEDYDNTGYKMAARRSATTSTTRKLKHDEDWIYSNIVKREAVTVLLPKAARMILSKVFSVVSEVRLLLYSIFNCYVIVISSLIIFDEVFLSSRCSPSIYRFSSLMFMLTSSFLLSSAGSRIHPT
jgi:hypothetical protein